MEPHNRPSVGVGVWIVHAKQILLGLRRGEHGGGFWAPPGGHLEYGETPEACAAREALEECGIAPTNIRFHTLTNDVFPDRQAHYVTLHMLSDADGPAFVNAEPDKCEKWAWFPFDALPRPLFLPFSTAVEAGSLSRLLKNDSDDGKTKTGYREIFNAMKRVSERSGHDMPTGKQMPLPTLDDMKADLNVLDKYRVVLKKKADTTAERRKDLEKPPRAEVAA